ncbi:MAG: UrcA family protein [Alphaproteobacteria bacterium]|nr:UrcA family protein [Alphaproteobacteria bacterium]MBV9370349.1 UrcA family protein [Alphaproteobacteria bacterium]MBV9901994.1 UrcA family protein [Alphaproteobacteria bacterium]
MFNRTLSALAAVALTGATLAIGTPASAQTVEDSIAVRYGDLDLSDGAGAAQLELRLRQAASQVCGDYGRDLSVNSSVQACKTRALANAKSDMRVALAAPAGTGRSVTLRTN